MDAQISVFKRVKMTRQARTGGWSKNSQTDSHDAFMHIINHVISVILVVLCCFTYVLFPSPARAGSFQIPE